jgi:hypothetical protein
MNEGLTAGDILALTKNNENGMWDNPFIYLVWLAVLGGGNGLFGNRSNDAAVQGAITRSDLFEGFNNQDVNGQLRGITNGLCDGFYAINSGLKDGFYGTQAGMKDGFYGIQGALAENRFAAQNCCCETNRNIDAVRYEGAQNTCAITNAIHAEGEATRALINANTMQDLRDKLEARDRDVMVRDFQLSQLAQSANLVSELRPCAKPAYITCSPYTTAGYGCGPCTI